MTAGNGSTHKPFKREPLIAPRIKAAEFAYTTYRAYPEKGTTLDELREPKYWSHISSMLRQFDKIEAIEESGAFIAELLVTGCDRNWATVEVLNFKDLRSTEKAATPEAPADEFKVEYAGPVHKHRVVRVSDGKVLFKGGQTKAEAEQFLVEHRATVAA